jgi:hypothetical protein
MNDNQTTETISGCAIKVHRKLGPGLLESAFANPPLPLWLKN